MPDGSDTTHPISVPDKPALEGLEKKWTERWERDAVYRFDLDAADEGGVWRVRACQWQAVEPGLASSPR